ATMTSSIRDVKIDCRSGSPSLTPDRPTATIATPEDNPLKKAGAMGNVEIIQGGYEAFGRGDVPSVLALFDPNIEWRQAEGNPYKPDGTAWVGEDAIVQNLFMRFGTEWDGFTVTAEKFHDA